MSSAHNMVSLVYIDQNEFDRLTLALKSYTPFRCNNDSTKFIGRVTFVFGD